MREKYILTLTGRRMDWEAELKNVWLDPPLTIEEIEQIEQLKAAYKKRRREIDPDQLTLFHEERIDGIDEKKSAGNQKRPSAAVVPGGASPDPGDPGVQKP